MYDTEEYVILFVRSMNRYLGPGCKHRKVGTINFQGNEISSGKRRYVERLDIVFQLEAITTISKNYSYIHEAFEFPRKFTKVNLFIIKNTVYYLLKT